MSNSTLTGNMLVGVSTNIPQNHVESATGIGTLLLEPTIIPEDNGYAEHNHVHVVPNPIKEAVVVRDDEKGKGKEASSAFMGIPPEVRWQILTRLPQRTAIRLRLTCRQLRGEIDQSYKVTIHVDDKNSTTASYITHRFPQLFIKEIIIKHWTQPELIFNMTQERRHHVEVIDIQGPVLPKFLLELLFKFPKVKKFFYSHHHHGDYSLSQNQTSALGSYISAATGRVSPLFPSLGFQGSLTSLTLRSDLMQWPKNISLLLPEECASLSDFLRYNYPHLKEFSVGVRVPQMDLTEFQPLLFDFIRRHKDTLNCLNIAVHPFPMMLRPRSLASTREQEGYDFLPESKYKFAFPQLSEKSLSGLKLKTLYLNLPPAFLNMWKALLDGVTKAHRFIGNILCGSHTFTFYQEIIHNNYKTLKVVKLARIRVLHGGVQTPFDCRLLQACENLEQLILDNEYLFHLASEWEQDNYPEIVGIDLLPPSLHFLEIFWMRIESDSLKIMISRLPLLNHVVLRNVGANQSFGITPITCQLLINHKYIRYLCLVGMNVSVPAESAIMDDIISQYEKNYTRETNSITIHRFKHTVHSQSE